MFPIRSTVPTRYPPTVTWTLIAINCAVFLYEASLSEPALESFLYRYALVPALYFTGTFAADLGPLDYLPFVTNMFLHGGWLHLILNMWMLWLFGGTVEDRLGPGRYLAFYIVCGVAASLAHAIFNPTSTDPALGASGAIAGIMGCYLRLFPLARVVILVPVLFFPFFFEVPAFVFVGVWFFIQVLQGTMSLIVPAAHGGVAWWAHIGGFVAGLAFASLLVRPQQRYRPYYADEGIYGFDTSGRP
jgi:membrane associated rhomboid family serine protease